MSAARKGVPTDAQGADWLRVVTTPPRRAGIDPLEWRGPDYKQLKAVGSIHFGVEIVDADINRGIAHDRHRNTGTDTGVLIWQRVGIRQCLKLSFNTVEQMIYQATRLRDNWSRMSTSEVMMAKTANGVVDPAFRRPVHRLHRDLTRVNEDLADIVEAVEELL